MSMDGGVVVVGGSRGIGRRIVQEFSDRGLKVASISTHAAVGLPSGVSAFEADVRSYDSLALLSDRIAAAVGPVRVWINCAGYGKVTTFASSQDWEAWDDIIAVNFLGTVNACRAAWPMLQRPGGVVINIASIAGMMAPRGLSAYATAKGAVLALTRALAVDWAAAGVRVCAVAPGPVDTEGFRRAGGDPEVRAKKIPMQKMIDEGEVARACAYLGLDAESQTGTVLVIDGGSTAAGCYV